MTDVVEHLISAETCVVAFASNDGDSIGDIPRFEFGNMLETMGVAYVLCRDSTGYRQHYGILGVGDRATVVGYLFALHRRYSRLVLTGVSSGAMAAVLYGLLVVERLRSERWLLMNQLEVIVISPYSNVGDPFGAYGKDWQTRGPWDISSMSLLSDLKPLFDFDKRLKVKTRAFYSDGNGTDQDVEQAHRIGVTDLTLIPGASHSGLGRLMRDNGTLQRVLLGERI